MKAQFTSDPWSSTMVFSPRERQVLQALAEGLTVRQIARRLRITPYRVRSIRHKIRVKLSDVVRYLDAEERAACLASTVGGAL